jgi:threonine dehydrogenase-like Zn-dependent dehydrogenase
MQQLVLEGTAAVRWADATRPPLSDAGAAVVRPLAVATCDIDVAVLRGRYPLARPYPFGHEAMAEVVESGTTCAPCGPCRRGPTGNCAAHPRLSTDPHRWTLLGLVIAVQAVVSLAAWLLWPGMAFTFASQPGGPSPG